MLAPHIVANSNIEAPSPRPSHAAAPEGAQPHWGSGAAMRQVATMINRVADSDVSVLISGESGVGKEVVARELHRQSSRRTRTFVKVNCAALPADLLESELFGHERGAFTGAHNVRIGKFEFADEGTILLDEIGEMPPALQAKLLHVLQDREFTRLGSNRPVSIDVRIIAATNRDLDQMIGAGQFREDLYYRLQVIEIRVPPLRERIDEVLPLVDFFLLKHAAQYRRPDVHASMRLRAAFCRYAWPGNIRELENVIKRFVILRDEDMVLAELDRMPEAPHATNGIPPVPAEAPIAVSAEPPAAPMTAKDVEPPAWTLPELSRRAALLAEREAIQHALDRLRWNRRKTAELLGVSYKTLLNKMKECGISASASSAPSPSP